MVPPPGEQVDEEEADRPAAVDHGVGRAVPGRAVRPDRAQLETVQHAGERLGERRDLERQAVGQRIGAERGEAGGDEEVLGEGAVQIAQIGAQVLAAVPAPFALAAGDRVGDDDPVTGPPTLLLGTDRLYGSGHLVAERGGRLQHARMAAAAQHLDVGAAGGGGADAHQDLAGTRLRHRHAAQLHPLRAEQIDDALGGPLQGRPPASPSGASSTLSARRSRASSTARAIADSGRRWVTSGVGSRRRETRSRQTSRCSARALE